MDAVNAERARGLSIGRDVVDINRPVRIDCKAGQHDLINARVGFDDPDLARDHHAAEPAKKIEALQRRREGLGRKIAEAVERRAAFAQFGEDLDRAGDRSGHHFIEAGAIGVDHLGLVGVLEPEQTRAFGKAAPGILATVPLMGADIGQEMLHRRLVAREKLAVKMARIPIDQHTADIENYDASALLRHSLAFEIQTPAQLYTFRRSSGSVDLVASCPRNGAMLASIWLRLSDEQEALVGTLIERLAIAHGTV